MLGIVIAVLVLPFEDGETSLVLLGNRIEKLFRTRISYTRLCTMVQGMAVGKRASQMLYYREDTLDINVEGRSFQLVTWSAHSPIRCQHQSERNN